jgi:hypothetical protein
MNIVFSAAEGTWESKGIGYKGSFDFNRETSTVTLTAEEKLNGFRWEKIDPIHSFSSGRVKAADVTLDNFYFYSIVE